MKNLGIIILLLISIIGASVLLISVKGTAAEGPGSDYGIYGQIFSVTNSRIGNPFLVNSYTNNKQEFPSHNIHHYNLALPLVFVYVPPKGCLLLFSFL